MHKLFEIEYPELKNLSEIFEERINKLADKFSDEYNLNLSNSKLEK